MPGVFNQNITGMQAGTNWNQALNIWTTPWGFLKGAAANNATVRKSQGGQQVVSFSPANLKSPSGQTYTVTGYINSQNLVTKVETRVDNAVVGDLLVEFEYSNYQNMNGVQVPAPHRSAPGRHADVRCQHHRGDAESAEPRRVAHPTASAGRRPAAAGAQAAAGAGGAQQPAGRRSRSSATASSRSAATTPRSPSTWAITSWWSRAARATRAARR